MIPEQKDTIYYFNVLSLPKRAVDLINYLDDCNVIRAVGECVVVNVKKAERIKQVREAERLTKRRLQVAECVANGLNYKEGAKHLDISIHTFKSTLNSVFMILEVNSSAEMAAVLMEAGLINLWPKEDK